MFKHVFINNLKIILRNKAVIFWTLIFPLVLATFFNLAFSNIGADWDFEVIDIAIVENDKFKEETYFKSLIDTLSEKNDNQLFNTKYVDENTAKEMLEDKKISAYIITNEKIDVYIRNNGIAQTIVKSVVDNYYQVLSLMNNIEKENPEALTTGVINKLNENTNYFNDANNKKIDEMVISYYSLIGMICLYGSIFGMNAVMLSEANLSTKGARNCISPTNKLKSLLASLTAGFLVHYMEVVILIAYLILILKINFASQTGLILLITLVGSLAGSAFGVLVGVSNKKSENVKSSMLTGIIMLFCFLAGMMSSMVKYQITKHVPVLGNINPVNLITDGLYSLFYYDTLDRYILNIMYLSLFTIVITFISYIFLRRKKYDSI